jgi:DNA topoisomerase-1
MKLVIVESPAKCQKIQGFLGPGFKVVASMGHIRALEEDLEAVGLTRDFEAKFHFLKEKARAMANLKEAAEGADTVYLAADDDREGEAIAYSVALLLKLNPQTTPRAVFHEITEKAVKEAVANPRRIDMNRVNAQQARSILDMMVGFTISRLLWRHVGNSLSAGRCQTPALRLVVEKETEIRNFKSASSWKIQGTWKKGDLELLANMVEDLEDEESSLNYLENLHADLEGVVKSAETKPWTESAPKPLITSTLQQEASALYRVNPKSAMQSAQRLYEAGHITYMRTDKAVLSEEAVATFQGWVRTNFGVEYVGSGPATAAEPQKKKAASTKEKEGPKAQEAHEAIRPTHIELRTLPENEDWSATDRKIYTLISNRAIQSVMATARGETRRIQLQATGDPCEFLWASTYKRTTFPGWKKLGQTAKLDEEEGESEAEASVWKQVEAVKVGAKFQWTSIEANPYQTKASPRYAEATLVRELEKKGIGRPSTFAMLLAAIQDKEYVKKEDMKPQKVQRKKYAIQPNQWPPTSTEFEQSIGGEKDKLVPTPLGERVAKFCVEKFNDLFDYGFTAQMETRLDKIAEGNEQWKQVLRDTWASYKDRYELLKAADTERKDGQKQFGVVKAVQSKKGPLLLIESPDGDKEKTKFLGWPEGVSWDEMTPEKAAAFAEQKQQETAGETLGVLDGKPIERKKGPFGSYVVWGTTKLSIKGTETQEEIEKALREKANEVLHTLGPFEFRKGQYGLYMFKKDIKQKKFVGLPEGLDPKKLTQEEAVKLYQNGLQQKARATHFKNNPQTNTGTAGGTSGGTSGGTLGGTSGGTSGGGGRGRGGFRGRGRGGRGRGGRGRGR